MPLNNKQAYTTYPPDIGRGIITITPSPVEWKKFSSKFPESYNETPEEDQRIGRPTNSDYNDRNENTNLKFFFFFFLSTFNDLLFFLCFTFILFSFYNFSSFLLSVDSNSSLTYNLHLDLCSNFPSVTLFIFILIYYHHNHCIVKWMLLSLQL